MWIMWIMLSGCGWGQTELCASPEPIVSAAGDPMGYVECDDGTILRTEAETQQVIGSWESCHGDEDNGTCASDADCESGYCLRVEHLDDKGPGCRCEPACVNDSDCGDGQVCIGSEIVFGFPSYPRCITADCTSNSDCPSQECSLSVTGTGCGGFAYLACRDPEADTCRTNHDCALDCDYDPVAGHWACATEEPCNFDE